MSVALFPPTVFGGKRATLIYRFDSEIETVDERRSLPSDCFRRGWPSQESNILRNPVRVGPMGSGLTCTRSMSSEYRLGGLRKSLWRAVPPRKARRLLSVGSEKI